MGDGSALLQRLARDAVSRLLASPGGPAVAPRLFTPEELDRLTDELAAVRATSLLLGRSLVRDHADRVRRRRQRKTQEGRGVCGILDVPVVLQSTGYTCGAACLLACLRYHGGDGTEAAAAQLLNTTPESGTSPEALARLARQLGLQTEARTGASLDDLTYSLQHNAPVICAVQSHGGGHWVVVVGIESGKAVHLMDPLTGPKTIPAEEFLAAWWDTANGKRYDRFALAIGAPVQESRLHRILEAQPTPILQPDAALDFFRSLVPMLGTDPQRILPDLRRTAFTLAVATEQELLQTVQQVIADRLASGEVGTGSAAVRQVLDAAGVGADARYAETVFRTNAMDAYNQGAQDQIAEEAETFPVWMYSNPSDVRSRPEHAKRDGNYYPTSVPFTRVRGTEKKDVMNCRCVPIPIDKWDWAERKANGARIAEGYPDVSV